MKVLSDELVQSIKEALNNFPNTEDITNKGESSYDLAEKLGQELENQPPDLSIPTENLKTFLGL